MKKLLLAVLASFPTLSNAGDLYGIFEDTEVVHTSSTSMRTVATNTENGLLNFHEIFNATRVGVFLDQHIDKSIGVYSTLLSFHDRSGIQCVNVNVGYLRNVEQGKNSPILQAGFRLDNLLSRLFSSDWSQSHVSLSPLPEIEAGPFVSTWFKKSDGALKLDLLYGIGIALRL